jgi:predicted HAD superfamily phosphohydrolase YqeG
MMIKAILFDLDNPLIGFRGMKPAAIGAAAKAASKTQGIF